MKTIKPLIFICIVISLTQEAFAQETQMKTSEEIQKQLSAPIVKTKGMKMRGFMSAQSFNNSNPGKTTLGAIQFKYNSIELTDAGEKQVNELAKAINNLDSDKFTVIGHTDASGGEEYNLGLSKKRAAAVVDILNRKFGVSRNRLSSEGEGETSLLDTENPSSAKNRRVEVINNGLL